MVDTVAQMLAAVMADDWKLNSVGQARDGWFAQLVRGGERVVETGPTACAAIEAALRAATAPAAPTLEDLL